MSLPLSRNTNYAPTSPILSNDLNAIQDCIIGGKVGNQILSISGAAFAASTGGPSWSATLGLAASPVNAVAAIPLGVGCRITAVRVFVKDNAVGPTKMQATLSNSDHLGGGGVIASSALSAGTGANQTLTITPVAFTMLAGIFYFVGIVTPTGAAVENIYGAEVDFFRP